MSDNINVYDKDRNTVVMATKDVGGVEHSKVMITNSSGTILEFGDYAGIGVITHEHPGHGTIHFHVDGISASASYILVDLSDTTNYPHTNTEVLHVDALYYNIDSSVTASFDIDLYYLENVGATDGDLHMWYSISGSNSTGNNFNEHINWVGAGPIMRSGVGGTKASSNVISLNDPNYSSADLYKSTNDVLNANTPCGSGDILMKITINAGTINLKVGIAYHSHDALHP